jgi:hypothetical protein
MGVFDKVEKRLEGAVNGVFARAFKGDVQPVEITARLQKEIDAEATILSRERKLVPNEFTVWLGQHDYDKLTPYSRTLNAEIIPQLREYATERGYIFNGPLSIDYQLERSLGTGRFDVRSAAVAGVEAEVTPSPLRPRGLAVEVNGIRHPLTPPGLVIGRGTEADLRINDPGISRRHARINVQGSGADTRLTIEDLGSTNGIVVDGQRVRTATLEEGSKFSIGSTHLAIVSPAADA